MLDAARDMPCIRCGKEGETRACHYTGLWQHQYGKGRGQKCSDLMTAEFCRMCDEFLSEGTTPFGNDIMGKAMRSDEFHHWIAMTNLRRLENGWLG